MGLGASVGIAEPRISGAWPSPACVKAKASGRPGARREDQDAGLSIDFRRPSPRQIGPQLVFLRIDSEPPTRKEFRAPSQIGRTMTDPDNFLDPEPEPEAEIETVREPFVSTAAL